MPDEPDETQAMPPSDRPGGPPATGWLTAGRYRVIGRVGAGGMAEVFRAHDESLNRDVALKVFRSDVAEAGDAVNAERQRMELQSLARLNHPNLITLYDGSMSGGGQSFLVMELIEGQDLAARLQHGPLTPTQARSLGAQMAGALAYVHSQGLAHRDVKPANILLGDDGRARLSDFGIVRLIGSPRMTSPDLTVGTASYLAPEQARGGDIGAPADVYSLGLVLIEALTGQRSFDGPMLEAMAARLSRGPHIPVDLPPPWPQLLAAMTAMDPAARPTAAQVEQTLRGDATGPTVIVAPAGGIAEAATSYVPPVAAGSTSMLPPVPPMPPVARPREQPVPAGPPEREGPGPWRAVLLTLAGLAILAIAGVLIYAVSSGSGDSGGGGSTVPSTAPTSPSSSRSSSSEQSSSRSSSESSSEQTRTRTRTRTRTSEPSSPSTSRTSESSSSSPSSSRPSSSSSSSSSSASTTPGGPGGGGGNGGPGNGGGNGGGPGNGGPGAGGGPGGRPGGAPAVAGPPAR